MEYHQTLAADTVLNADYRVIRLLGSGGFGNTYLALDTTLEREVAVKEYFPSELVYRSGPEIARLKTAAFEDNFKWGRDRFVQEGRTLAKFRHPNIVRVFRTFDANDTSYMVLEFVKGADMEVWLKGLQHRPTQEELDRLVGPILEALDLVHGSGILHRDIKPANIYIREEDGSPVLLDFGAARYSVGELTGTTAAIVSRGYSPHEGYASDAKLQGPWTDLYGVAATLYRALSGEAPPEAAGRVLDDTLVPTAEVVPDAALYRPEFLEAVDWGLQVLPRNRPQTVAEWREHLLSGSTLGKVESGPPSQPRSAGGLVSRPSARGPDSKPSRPSVGRPSVQKGATRPSPTVLTPDAKVGTSPPIGAIASATVAFCGLTFVALWLTGVVPSPFGGPSGSPGQPIAVQGAKDTPTGEQASEGKTVDRAAKERDEEARKAEEERVRVAELAKQEEERKAEEERQRAAAAAKADGGRKRKDDTERKASDEKQRLAMLAKQAEEERRRQDEARKADEERQRQAALVKAEEERKRKEAERKADEERQRQAALAKAEEERKRKEDERKADEERQRQAALAKAEEERKRKEDERRADEERQRQAAIARADEERRRKEDEQRKADEERERKEAEARQQDSVPAASDRPNEEQLSALVKKIQEGLKDRRCYDGEPNGDSTDADAALRKFNSRLEQKGRSPKQIRFASATIEDFELWMQWFNSVDGVTCAAAPSDDMPSATDRPNEALLSELIKKIQSGLRDRRCYDGEINGDSSDTNAALDKFNSQLERKGKDAKPILLASATIENFESWMQWFNAIDGVTCTPPKVEDDDDKPARKKPAARKDPPPAKPRVATPSPPSSGTSVKDLLRSTR